MGKAQRATARAKEPNFMKEDGQCGIYLLWEKLIIHTS